jgi:DUF1680 family protein
MEAASYTLAWRADPGLDRKLNVLIELYAAAQDKDGYINQMFMLPDEHPQSPENAIKARLGYGIDQRFQGTIEQWPLCVPEEDGYVYVVQDVQQKWRTNMVLS